MNDHDAKETAARGDRGGPADKPGVLSIGGDQVALLDQHIADKRDGLLLEQSSNKVDTFGAEGDVASVNIGQVEHDVISKQMSRSAAAIPVKPGAFPATNQSSTASNIGSIEADTIVKQTGTNYCSGTECKHSKAMATEHGEQYKTGHQNKSDKFKKDEQDVSAMQEGFDSIQNHHGLSDLEFGEYGGTDETGLAMALAVEEDDGDMFIPSAVEHDPDAKPPMYRNRRFRMYLCLAMTAVIVGTVGAVLGITMTTDEGPSPVPYRATLGIRENVARVVSNEKLEDYTSAYYKALDWITFVDPMAITPEDPKLMQRYFMAYFYYATSVKKQWKRGCAPADDEQDSCTFVSTAVRSEVDTLLDVKGSRWLSGVDECRWVGVDCDNSFQIRGIELRTFSFYNLSVLLVRGTHF
jgi:hypothetical protein